MDFIAFIIDFIIHIDVHLTEIVSSYGTWTYAILFAILFAETGLVVTPFLPGDSLLFTAGALAALGALDPWILFILLSFAAIVGDSVNYWIGHRIGPAIFERKSSWFFRQEHLRKAEAFYEKHGGKTIIMARFMPIIRTFAPFVAGISRMNYSRFFLFNIVGGVVWVGICLFAGYFVGNIPWVKHNFEYIIFGIIAVSFMPPIYHAIKEKLSKSPQTSQTDTLPPTP